MVRREQSDQGSEDEAGDEASDVGGVVDAGHGVAEDQVVEDEDAEAAQGALQGGARNGKFSELKGCDERASQSEDRSRSAYAGAVRVPHGAGQAGADAAEQIDGGVGPASVERFGELAQIPEAPHIESDVQQASVNEDAGEQPPPFARHGEYANVGSPMENLHVGKALHWIDEGERSSRGEDHPKKYGGVDAEDDLSEVDGRFAAADPGVAHDGLARVLDNFSALVGFVLHAPLADFLAEGKAGKLASTSNAICHE